MDHKKPEAFIAEAVKKHHQTAVALSDDLYAHPELPDQEFRSSEKIVEILRQAGYEVEYPYLGWPTGFKAVLCNPIVSTAITVVLGVGLGMTGYSKIWPLFGAANQLLAALALLAVCAWLGNIGKNNKMFYIPMIFMLIVTLTSLAQTISTQVGKITAGAATDWAPYAQAILGVLLFILAIVLAVEGCMTIFGKKKNTAAK